MKPLTDVLYFQGATDQNISSARPLSKLLIQMSPLGLGKASHANRRSDLKGEQEIPRLPEQAGAARTGCAEKQVGGGVVRVLYIGRGNCRSKVLEKGDAWSIRKLKMLRMALARGGEAAASFVPRGTPELF